MINIETLPLDRFTNSEHQNALRSLAMVVKKNTTNEKIKQCAEKLAEAIKEEETIADGHNIDRYTKELNDADTQQTNSCLALRQCLKGYLKVSMKPEKDAAKEILSFMNLCKIEFKGQRDNRTSEIKVFIESMLHRQEHDYMADINLLMLNKIFDDIRKHNKLVYALQTKQEQEQSSLGTYRKRRARNAREEGAGHKRNHLVFGKIDAHGLCRDLIVADGFKGAAVGGVDNQDDERNTHRRDQYRDKG
jgi:hypothetical protein